MKTTDSSHFGDHFFPNENMEQLESSIFSFTMEEFQPLLHIYAIILPWMVIRVVHHTIYPVKFARRKTKEVIGIGDDIALWRKV